MTPLRVLAAGVMWRFFGARSSADTLLEAVSSQDEQNRMLAGMSLVKAGDRSFDLIEDQIDTGEATPSAVRLLPDIDLHRARDVMEKVATRGGDLVETATECIDTIDRIESVEDD
jgi:radical SAM superfamily enzyme with C-terminal helix-hairpin-helix motif